MARSREFPLVAPTRDRSLARSLARPPAHVPAVECLEIKLIVVIKLLETYRSGPPLLVNHPSVQLAAPFVMESWSKGLGETVDSRTAK